MIAPSWRARWSEITPFLAFPEEIRHAIYTTNAIEALHRHLRKALKTRGALPDDDAALKILFLAIRDAAPHGAADTEPGLKPCSSLPSTSKVVYPSDPLSSASYTKNFLQVLEARSKGYVLRHRTPRRL